MVLWGICCSFGWMAAKNTVDFDVRENFEVFGEWVREKKTDRKVRFALIVGAR